MKSYLCLHYHHGVLGEFVTESVADRIAFNRRNKAPAELATRERLIQAVPEELLTPLLREAREAREAWKAWEKAWEKAQPDLIALHAKLCVTDCPWDGKTIFPSKPI